MEAPNPASACAVDAQAAFSHARALPCPQEDRRVNVSDGNESGLFSSMPNRISSAPRPARAPRRCIRSRLVARRRPPRVLDGAATTARKLGRLSSSHHRAELHQGLRPPLGFYSRESTRAREGARRRGQGRRLRRHGLIRRRFDGEVRRVRRRRRRAGDAAAAVNQAERCWPRRRVRPRARAGHSRGPPMTMRSAANGRERRARAGRGRRRPRARTRSASSSRSRWRRVSTTMGGSVGRPSPADVQCAAKRSRKSPRSPLLLERRRRQVLRPSESSSARPAERAGGGQYGARRFRRRTRSGSSFGSVHARVVPIPVENARAELPATAFRRNGFSELILGGRRAGGGGVGGGSTTLPPRSSRSANGSGVTSSVAAIEPQFATRSGRRMIAATTAAASPTTGGGPVAVAPLEGAWRAR